MDRGAEITVPRSVATAREPKIRQSISAWTFLIPALTFFVCYQVYPIFRIVWISFTDFEFLSTEPANWIGFGNYIEAYNDPLMWKSMGRAALFTVMFLPGTIIFPLILAILVDRVRHPLLATCVPTHITCSGADTQHSGLCALEVDVQLSDRSD